MADNATTFILSAVDNTQAAFNSVKNGIGQVETAATKLSTIAQSLPGIGTAFAAALGGAGLVASIADTIKATAELERLGQVAGVSGEKLSAFKTAAKLSGTDLEGVVLMMNKLTKNMNAMGDEGKLAGQALLNIGLSAKQLREEAPDQVMMDLAKSLEGYADGQGKVATAIALMGKAGAQALPMLHELAIAGELHAKSTSAQIAAAKQYEDNLIRLRAAGDAWKKSIANEIVPALSDLSDWMLEGYKKGGMLLGILVAIGAMEAKIFGADISKKGQADNSVNEQFAKVMQLQKDLEKARAVKAQGSNATVFDFVFGGNVADLEKDVIKAKAALSSLAAARDAIYKNDKSYDKKPNLPVPEGPKTIAQLSEMEQAYNRIVGAANKYRAELDAQLVKGQALTAAEKLMAEAKSELSGSLFAELEAYLKQNIAKEQSVLMTQAMLKAEDELQKAAAQRLQDSYKKIDSLDKEIAKQREANAEIGLTGAALAEVKDQRDLLTISMMEQELAGDKLASKGAAEIESLTIQIEQMKELRSLRAQGAVKQIAADEAKKSAEAWKQAADEIDRALTDALMRGFENGKGGAQAFIDSLKNSLKTAVFKIAVKAIVDPVMGSVGSTLGVNGSAGGSSALGTASNISSLWNAYSGSTTSAATSFATSSMGSSLGLSQVTPYIANAELGTEAIIATSTELTTLGSSFAAASPYIAAAIVAVNVISSLLGKGGGPKTEGDFAAIFNKAGGITQSSSTGGINGGDWYTAHSADSQMADMSKALGSGIASLIKNLGGNAAGIGTRVGYNTDPQGTAPDNFSAAVFNAKGDKVYGNWGDVARGGASAQMELEAKRIMLASVNAAEGIDKLFIDIVSGIDLAKASSTELDAALKRLSDTKLLRDEFKVLGLNIAGLTTTLIDAAGGTTALIGNLDTYYQNFYSDAERSANVTKTLSDQFAALGQTMPTTRDAFREAVTKASGDMTDTGRATFAALVSMSGAFASVVPAADAAAAAVTTLARSAADIANERKGMQTEYDNLTMTSTDLLKKQRDALDASNQGLFDLIQTAKSLNAAIATAGSQKDTLTSSFASTAAPTIQEAINGLYTSGLGSSDQIAALLAGPTAEFSAWLKGLVTSIDPATEAGRALAQTLTNLSPAFAALLDNAAKVAAAAHDFNRAMLVATGNSSGLTAFDLAAEKSSMKLAGWTDVQIDALVAARAATAAAATLIDAMKTIAAQMNAVTAFQGTVADARQNIVAQMPGYSAPAFYAGQITQYTGEMNSAVGTDKQLAAAAKLRDAITGKYNAELAAIKTNAAAAEAAARSTFEANQQAANAAAQVAFDASESIRKSAIDAQNAMNAAFRKVGEYAAAMITSALSPLSSAEQLIASSGNYSTLLGKSRAGDMDALGKLTGAADQVLTLSRDQAATRLDYERLFAQTQQQLAGVGNQAGQDLEFVARKFYADTTQFQFDSSAFDAQSLDLQTRTLKAYDDLTATTKKWQEDLQKQMDDQAIAYTQIGLDTTQIANNTAAIGPGFEAVTTAITNALAAKKLAEDTLTAINNLTAQVVSLQAATDATARSTAATARVLDRVMPDGESLQVVIAP